MTWLVAGTEINDARDDAFDQQLLLWSQPTFVVKVRQRLSDHFDVRILLADVELVETLIADVVSNIFDHKQNHRVGISDDLPRFNHRVAKARQGVVLWQLLDGRIFSKIL